MTVRYEVVNAMLLNCPKSAINGRSHAVDLPRDH